MPNDKTAHALMRCYHNQDPLSEAALLEAEENARRQQLKANAFDRVTELASTLNEPELRLLLYLCRLCTASPSKCAALSLSDIEKALTIARSSVQLAIAKLTKRELIGYQKRGKNRGTFYWVNVLQTVPIGVPIIGTPITLFDGETLPAEAQGVPIIGTPETENAQGVPTGNTPSSTGLPIIGTPATENQQLTEESPALDLKDDLLPIVDRVLTAKTKNYTAAQIAWWQGHLHEVMCKQGPWKDAAPPDVHITREILSCGAEAAVLDITRGLVLKRTRIGEQYAYITAVVLQRLYGISPEKLAERREYWKGIRKLSKSNATLIQGGKAANQAAHPAAAVTPTNAQPNTHPAAAPEAEIEPAPDFSRDLVAEAAERLARWNAKEREKFNQGR